MLNAAAFSYMRTRALPTTRITQLGEQTDTVFADQAAWSAHLDRLGFTTLTTRHPSWCRSPPKGPYGAASTRTTSSCDAVVLSDDAGQFAVGRHALCWVHAERLVHKLDAFTDFNRAAQQHVRKLIWNFDADLKAYQTSPGNSRRLALRTRFDRIFRRRTGFTTLDRLLAPACQQGRVIDCARPPYDAAAHQRFRERHPLPGHTAEGQRRNTQQFGRDCRDTFLGLAKTCTKLGVAFWDYLGSRLRVPGQAPHSTSAGTYPLPWAASLRPAPARGFAPVTNRRTAAARQSYSKSTGEKALRFRLESDAESVRKVHQSLQDFLGVGERAMRDGRHRVPPDEREEPRSCALREAPWSCLLCALCACDLCVNAVVQTARQVHYGRQGVVSAGWTCACHRQEKH